MLWHLLEGGLVSTAAAALALSLYSHRFFWAKPGGIQTLTQATAQFNYNMLLRSLMYDHRGQHNPNPLMALYCYITPTSSPPLHSPSSLSPSLPGSLCSPPAGADSFKSADVLITFQSLHKQVEQEFLRSLIISKWMIRT